MNGSTHRTHRRGGMLAALLVLLALAVGGTAAAGVLTDGGGATRFAATFEARAVGDPATRACRSLPAVQQVEGRYRGTMTLGGEEVEFNFTLEALVDRGAGLGSAEGTWQLLDPRTGALVGRGELVGVVGATTPLEPDLEPPDPDLEPPDPELEPPDPELELRGLLTGLVSPADPDLPARKLTAAVAISITDGTHAAGSIGMPTDHLDAGLLLPAIRC